MSDDNTDARLDALEAEIEGIKLQLATDTRSLQALGGISSDLLQIVRQQRRDAEQDRELIRAQQAAMAVTQSDIRSLQLQANEDRALIRGTQAELARVIDHLFNQRRDGNGGQSEE